MTYNVFSGTLNLALSLTLSMWWIHDFGNRLTSPNFAAWGLLK